MSNHNNPTHSPLRINGSNSSPEAQQALRYITDRLAPQGINANDLAEERFDLAQELNLLLRLSALDVQPQVQPSHIPIIGGWVTRFKQAAHQLVLFYLRDLAAQQNAFNAQVVRILHRRDVPGD